MKNLFLFMTIIAVAVGCQSNSESTTQTEDESSQSLVGAWEWASSSYSDQDTSYQWTNVDGLIIITGKYYSTISVYQSEPRENLPDSTDWNNISEEQLRKTLGPVTSNSGTYEIEGDTIKLYRKVALWPGAMASENQPDKLPLPIWKDNNTTIWKFGNWDHTWKRVE